MTLSRDSIPFHPLPCNTQLFFSFPFCCCCWHPTHRPIKQNGQTLYSVWFVVIRSSFNRLDVIVLFLFVFLFKLSLELFVFFFLSTTIEGVRGSSRLISPNFVRTFTTRSFTNSTHWLYAMRSAWLTIRLLKPFERMLLFVVVVVNVTAKPIVGLPSKGDKDREIFWRHPIWKKKREIVLKYSSGIRYAWRRVCHLFSFCCCSMSLSVRKRVWGFCCCCCCCCGWILRQSESGRKRKRFRDAQPHAP